MTLRLPSCQPTAIPYAPTIAAGICFNKSESCRDVLVESRQSSGDIALAAVPMAGAQQQYPGSLACQQAIWQEPANIAASIHLLLEHQAHVDRVLGPRPLE